VHHQDGQQALAAASKRQAVLSVLKDRTLLLQVTLVACMNCMVLFLMFSPCDATERRTLDEKIGR
jgi:hypothetical protein